jgi:hypothetical protein
VAVKNAHKPVASAATGGLNRLLMRPVPQNEDQACPAFGDARNCVSRRERRSLADEPEHDGRVVPLRRRCPPPARELEPGEVKGAEKAGCQGRREAEPFSAR